MKQLSYSVSLYALIIFIGGVIGFVKAASLASFVMSSIFSTLLFICIVAMRRTLSWGFYGAFSIAVTLLVFFAYRFFVTQQFFPSGMMLLLSALMIGRLLFTKSQPISST